MKNGFVCVGAAAMLASMPAAAQIVVGANAGTFETFIDTSTNTQWLQLDNFFNQSIDNMMTAASAEGFILATRGDVAALLGTLPLDATGTNWDLYAAIMGSAPNRDLIWGAYQPVQQGQNYGWAYSFRNDGSWIFADNAINGSSIANQGGAAADLNLWAFRATSGVPEPGTWALLILGFGAIGVSMRRARRHGKVSISYG
ncbi:MAG: PEP-CTERM sorting domain-containing protein [Sphingomonas sp.]|nr:PEP-CTERM sorting domain-containing protein [Sphingomonas sp.]